MVSMPALLTRMSIGPSLRQTFSNMGSTWSRFDTSADDHRAPAFAADVVGDCLGAAGIVDVIDDDIRAFVRKHLGDAAADAAAGAGHQRNFSCEPQRASKRNFNAAPAQTAAEENERALRGGRDDVDGAVLVQVGGQHLRAGARAIVDELGHELGAARRLRVAHGPVHVEHRRTVRIGIEVALEVRQVPLADDEVRDPVAVDVGRGRAVRLGEGHAAGVLRRRSCPMITCCTNEIAPAASRFCSNQASPNPCACSDVTTSFSPSPLTS